MRRVLLLLVLLLPSMASAQSFIRYYPPSGGGTSTGGVYGNQDDAGAIWGLSNQLCFEGGTANAFETCIGGGDPSADTSLTLPGVTGMIAISTLVSDPGSASTVWFSNNSISFEGATADDFETTLTVTDPIADRAITLPDASGTVLLSPGAGFPADTDGSGTMAARTITAGAGISVANGAGAAGNPTISVDTAVTPQFSSGTGDVSATGSIGTFYAETDANSFYTYPSTDTEHWLLSIAAGQTAGRLFQTSATDVLAEITPTDETVLVSNGTTWEKKTLPDCDDSGGQHLNYNTADNTFSCGTSGGASSPLTSVDLIEEFIGGAVSGSQIGQLGWTGLAVNSGTATGSLNCGDDNYPGCYRLKSHATNDNSGYIFFLWGYGSSTGIATSTWNARDWDITFIVQPGTASTVITDIGMSVGMTNNGLATTADRGVGVRYDTDLSDATYIFYMCNAAGASGCGSAGDSTNIEVVASTVTPSAGRNDTFILRHRVSGVGGSETFYFSMNGETEKTMCASGCDDILTGKTTDSVLIPNMSYITRAGTADRQGGFDFFRLQMTVTR